MRPSGKNQLHITLLIAYNVTAKHKPLRLHAKLQRKCKKKKNIQGLKTNESPGIDRITTVIPVESSAYISRLLYLIMPFSLKAPSQMPSR